MENKLECYGFWWGRESAADGIPGDPVETRLLSLAFCCMGQFASEPSYLKVQWSFYARLLGAPPTWVGILLQLREPLGFQPLPNVIANLKSEGSLVPGFVDELLEIAEKALLVPYSRVKDSCLLKE